MKEQEVTKRLNFHKEYARLYSSRVVMISETDLETVLNMLKEKDTEIEKLQSELNKENKRCMILANNDKFKEQIIDLIALAILNYDDQLIINRYKNIDDVKQYFAGLVEKE